MFKTSLIRAVEQFAAVTQGAPDAELDREQTSWLMHR